MQKRTKALICYILISSNTMLFSAESPLDVNLGNEVYNLDSIASYVDPIDSNQSESKEQSENSTDEEMCIDGRVKVSTSLRLREYPWGPVLGSYTNNTKLKIIGEDGDFYKVIINGKTGYMHKNYVSTSSKAASCKEPVYPGNCKSGGYIAKESSNKTTIKKSSTRKTVSVSLKRPDANLTCPSDNTRVVNSSLNVKATSGALPVKASVIGAKQGDGTAAGAVTWAKDQMAGGSKKGYNKNNGKTSSSDTCWNYWCGAFIATAWGRKIPQMAASCAYGQYKNFKKAGMIHTDKNPPAGAIMFTAPTSSNGYGHVFMATGEVDSKGEPIVITSGWKGHNGITTMTLSKMIGKKKYLGWALPE